MNDKNKNDIETKNEKSNYYDDEDFFEIEMMLNDLMWDVKMRCKK